jgi:hypothetical protein
MKPNDERAFWSKVDRRQPDECWPWRAGRFEYGYGHFKMNGKDWHSHRLAYELSSGEIPAGIFVCHHCDNPPCCNPKHLFLGTPEDNVRDMIDKGRRRFGSFETSRRVINGRESWSKPNSRMPHGERHYNARLTLEQVAELRAAYATGGVRQVDLAARYGVDQTHVSRIVRGTKWAR